MWPVLRCASPAPHALITSLTSLTHTLARSHTRAHTLSNSLTHSLPRFHSDEGERLTHEGRGVFSGVGFVALLLLPSPALFFFVFVVGLSVCVCVCLCVRVCVCEREREREREERECVCVCWGGEGLGFVWSFRFFSSFVSGGWGPGSRQESDFCNFVSLVCACLLFRPSGSVHFF